MDPPEFIKPDLTASAEVITPDLTASAEVIPPDRTASSEVDGETQRETYTGKFQYYVTIVNNIVDFAKVLRFPYLAFKNGGGAFCLAYLVMLAVFGMPVFFMKSAIAQFCSQGDVKIWNAVPMFTGVGVANVVVNAVVSIYYPVMITYSLFYLFSSFASTLPWSVCSNSTFVLNISCSEQFFDQALRRSSGLDDTGPVIWYLALILLLVWVLTAVFMTRGVNATATVGTITAIGPLVVLVTLMFYGLTLEGAEDGIAYYIGSDSNMAKLQEPTVWLDAATQICFTLADIATATSYNKFHNNLFLDTICVSLIIDLGFNVIAGFPIFCILGHMAHMSGKLITDVAQEGYGLAFIAYADALAGLPYAPIWSILFFLMLFGVGLGSHVPGIEVIVTSLEDDWPRLRSKRRLVTVVICSVLFLVGLPCVTGAGIYWVTLIDHYVVEWVLIVISLMEMIGFIYIYGLNRLIEDIEMMIGKKGKWFWLYWKTCWLLIGPAGMISILISSLITSSPPSYGDVDFPHWGLDLGLCMVAFCLIWIPVIAVYKLIKAEGSLWTRVRFCLSPSEDWHPYLDEDRGERYRVTRPEPDLPGPVEVISLPLLSYKTLNLPALDTTTRL